jgi:hypothetical protein
VASCGIGGAGHGVVRLWLSPPVRRMLIAEREAPTRGPRIGRRDRAEPVAACGRWRDLQDADLLLSLAGIAGVFVGFGALISVRSGGSSEAGEVSGMRWVVSLGIWVVIAALAPVIVNRYDIAGHELWLVCSLLALVLFAVMFAVNGRAPETRAERAAWLAATPRATAMAVVQAVPTVWLPTVSIVLALALVVLGLFPDQEPALYLTAVAVGLFGAALSLLPLVFLQGRPAAASDPAALPATGGSST